MPMIREIIVTTIRRGRGAHAPLGIIADGDDWIIAPFRPPRRWRICGSPVCGRQLDR